jgi:hypothetical protein
VKAFIAISLFAALLTGCAQQAAFEELADGTCSGAQVELIDQHISAQIDALAKRDWELAYSFASDGFQERVRVDQFIAIIESQYAMLINNQGYQFNQCDIAAGMIMQAVGVRSGEEVFNLTYRLSVNGSTLGVEAAVINGVADQLNA